MPLRRFSCRPALCWLASWRLVARPRAPTRSKPSACVQSDDPAPQLHVSANEHVKADGQRVVLHGVDRSVASAHVFRAGHLERPDEPGVGHRHEVERECRPRAFKRILLLSAVRSSSSPVKSTADPGNAIHEQLEQPLGLPPLALSPAMSYFRTTP